MDLVQRPAEPAIAVPADEDSATEPEPATAAAIALPLIDPADQEELADDLEMDDLEDMDRDGHLLPRPAAAEGAEAAICKCAALVLWACCERSKELREMTPPADILGMWLESADCGLKVQPGAANKKKLDKIVVHVKALTDRDDDVSHLWRCKWNDTKKNARSWDDMSKITKVGFDKPRGKPWTAKTELRDELRDKLLVERGRLEKVCRTMPADGRGPISLLLADGSRQKSPVGLASAQTPARSEGGLRDMQISSPASAAAGGDDTPTPRETSVEQRLCALEGSVRALQDQRGSEELNDGGERAEKRQRKADLAYWMPLAKNLAEEEFEPGEVVAIVEAKATQTQEVRKLDEVAALDGARDWFPAVVSDVYYHVANEQPAGQIAVAVCMLGFVPVTVAQGVLVDVNDEICVFIDDKVVSIRARLAGEADGVLIGSAIEGSQAADKAGPRCFISMQSAAKELSREHRARLVDTVRPEKLNEFEESVQHKLSQLTSRVGKLEQNLSRLEEAVKGGKTGTTTTRKNFIGRRAELDAVREATTKPEQAIVMIWGQGGLGKTMLLHACRDELKAGYDAVVEIDGRGDRRAVEVNVASHAKALRVKMKPDLPVDEQVQAIKAKLVGQRCLFLIDNMDEAETTDLWGNFLSDSSEHWHVLVTTRVQAIVVRMKDLPGASELDELEPLHDDERLILVRGATRCRNDNDEEAATELVSLAGPFKGTTLCLVPCGKLVKLKLISPSQLLKRVYEHGGIQTLEELKDSQEAKVNDIQLDEVDRFMSIFDISFEHVERMLNHDDADFVRAAKLASAIVKTSAVYSSAPLSRLLLLRAAFHLDGREDWFTRYQPGRPAEGRSDTSEFGEADFDSAMSLLNLLGLCETVETDGSDHDDEKLQFHRLRRDLARRRFKMNDVNEPEAESLRKSCRAALSSLQDLDLPTRASKLAILPHLDETFPLDTTPNINLDVDSARAVMLRAKVRYGTTGDIESALHDCVQCLQGEGEIDQFSEAIILSGLSYLLRRYKYMYTQATSEHGWLRELYARRYQPDTAKPQYDFEAFHLAQRACLKMTPLETMTEAVQLAAWVTDEDLLGVKAFTSWLKVNAELIVEKLDDVSVIDFTNTIGSAVEYVRKTTGPKEAAELRKTGVYDLRVTRFGETHTASVSTRYHLARIQSDAGDYQAAQESYEHVYSSLERIYGDKMCGNHLTCKALAALAELPMTEAKSTQLCERFEKALSEMSQGTSAPANNVPDNTLPGVETSFWAAAEKKDAHVDTTVATFTCTHKQWKGQMELMTNGQFRRVDKDGGNWTIAWDARETDDGDKCGELTLTWFQWEPECLRTTDGGRTFKQQDYLFECGLNHIRTGPRWVPTGEILKTTKNYATVLGRSGKWQQALSLSEKLIKDLDGRSGLTKQQKNLHVDVLDIAGRMCVELGRTGDAIQLLERAKTSRERLVPTSLIKLSAHQLSTLHHLADAYRLDGRLKQALDTYTTLASALRERVEGDHAAQVWRWQDADKRTAQDWLSAAEACIANLEPDIQARMWQQCLGGGLFSRSALTALAVILVLLARRPLVGLLSLLWRRRGG